MRCSCSFGLSYTICKFIFFALLSAASSSYAGEMSLFDHPLVDKIWDMRSHAFIDEATLLASINSTDVLLLGEIHDNSVHHVLQQKLLKARIKSTGGAALKPALLMEQLDAESQPEIDKALAYRDRNIALSDVTQMIRFSNWLDYQPFLAIAIDNKLPVIGANVPNRKLQTVIRRGYSAYDAKELKRLAVEQVWNKNRQKYLEMNMGGAHCGKLRDGLSVALTRSQRLRDALMADSAMSSLDRGVVAIIGSSHARRDIGLPLYFSARSPTAKIISLAFIEVSPEVKNPKDYEADSATGEMPFDLVWFTPRVDRIDPCLNVTSGK